MAGRERPRVAVATERSPINDQWLRARDAMRQARAVGRPLIIEDVPWIVYEMAANQFDRRQTPVLVFEAENIIRRVRDFPANWRELPDETLIALSWSV